MAGIFKQLKTKAKEVMAGPDNTPVTHTLNVSIFEGRNLQKKDISSQTDPYCIANIHQDGRASVWNTVHRSTQTKFNNLNPVFNESFPLPIRRQMIESLHVKVYDKDSMGIMDRLIGEVYIPIADLMTGVPIDRWYDLVPARGGQIHIGLTLMGGWNDTGVRTTTHVTSPSSVGGPSGGYHGEGGYHAEGGYTATSVPYQANPAATSRLPVPESFQAGSGSSGYTSYPPYPQSTAAASSYPAPATASYPAPAESAYPQSYEQQPPLYPSASTAVQPQGYPPMNPAVAHAEQSDRSKFQNTSASDWPQAH